MLSTSDLEYRYTVILRGMHYIVFWFSLNAQATQVSLERYKSLKCTLVKTNKGNPEVPGFCIRGANG
jgi:hypothetical protein